MDRTNIIEQINRASLKLLLPLSVERTYKTIVHEAIGLARADCGAITLEKEGELKRAYLTHGFINKIKIQPHGFHYRVFRTHKPHVFNYRSLSVFRPDIIKFGVRLIVIIPLSYKKSAIGVFSLYFKNRDDYPAADLHPLILFGAMASLAIKKAQFYEETGSALADRDEFLSLAAHELRTPLTAISGYVQLLHKRLNHKKTVEANWVRALLHENNRMTSLMEELLEISRLQAGRLTFMFKESDFGKIMSDTISQIKKYYPERKIVYEHAPEKPVIIVGDTKKLARALFGLIENAIIYSSDNQPVILDLRSNASLLTLMIEDRGKGINPKELAKIFKGFYKSADAEKGLGMGLYLAKNIIEKHQGSLSIKSGAKGTMAKIKLPLVI